MAKQCYNAKLNTNIRGAINIQYQQPNVYMSYIYTSYCACLVCHGHMSGGEHCTWGFGRVKIS